MRSIQQCECSGEGYEVLGNYGCSFVLAYVDDILELFSATGPAPNFTGKDILQELNSVLKSKEYLPKHNPPAVSNPPSTKKSTVRRQPVAGRKHESLSYSGLAGLIGIAVGYYCFVLGVRDRMMFLS